MTYQKTISKLREEYKFATPIRKESIKCRVKALKIKLGIPYEEERDLEADVRETLL